MNATQAILAAVVARNRDGRGQLIDLSLLEGAATALANVASSHLATGRTPGRYGNAHATVAPYQVFDTCDGSFALAVGNDRQFEVLSRTVLDQPDLATDARFATNEERAANIGELEALLAPVFRAESTDHWLRALRANGVPAGAIRTVPEVLASPEMADRGMVVEVSDQLHGSLKVMASPLQMRGTPPVAPKAPPRLGEHTDEILREVLRASDDEIRSWRQKGSVA